MLDKEQLDEFFKTEFPQADFIIQELGKRSAVVKKEIGHQHLRPGGTVSGPTMMEVADTALYVAILNEIGLVSLAVTTNLNINFLRKPAANKDIIGECRLIKVGKSLIVGDVFLYSEGMAEPIAHATGTYSVPH
ncbi:PaaI family thioesterase [Psychrobium sp. MM17-31]|uniref:PaaI family thioesterase n=1 Tax=Psychrobium sp. MM17-31 TaxID=2917758 RepID=UPI001EF5400D|nr:PaaI family thioesterase [Psychrobium sp. MM17-31]MCG7530507.1 PaaI family thioesterase [Psychrobium sp. MM17-31]